MKKRRRKHSRSIFKCLLEGTRGRFVNFLILFICILIISSALLMPPDKIASKKLGLRWFFYCFMDDIFGVKCASCGLIRSFSAISRGQLEKSFDYHSTGPMLFVFIVLQIPYRSWLVLGGTRSVPMKIQQGHFFIVSIVLIIIIGDWLFLMGGNIL